MNNNAIPNDKIRHTTITRNGIDYNLTIELDTFNKNILLNDLEKNYAKVKGIIKNNVMTKDIPDTISSLKSKKLYKIVEASRVYTCNEKMINGNYTVTLIINVYDEPGIFVAIYNALKNDQVDFSYIDDYVNKFMDTKIKLKRSKSTISTDIITETYELKNIEMQMSSSELKNILIRFIGLFKIIDTSAIENLNLEDEIKLIKFNIVK